MLGSSSGTGNKKGTNWAKTLTPEFIVQLQETNNTFKYDSSCGDSAKEKN